MTRALESGGRSLASGGRGVLRTIGDSTSFVTLDDFEGYADSSELNNAYDNASGELELMTDSRLQSTQYVKDNTGKWYGNSSFLTSDATEYSMVIETTRTSGTVGMALHAQSLDSSQDIVNNCLRMVIRGGQDDLIIGEYNGGYNRHWSVDINIEPNTPYILTGWTDGDWAFAELREYSQGLDSEPIARVTNNGEQISWNSGFLAFEGDAEGHPSYFDYFQEGSGVSEGGEDISDVKVIDDFEAYGSDSEFKSTWNGNTSDWYLEDSDPINGTQSVYTTQGSDSIVYPNFTTQEGFKYTCLVRPGSSYAKPEFHVNKQGTGDLNEIGGRLDMQEQEFYGYVAEGGQILQDLSSAIDATAGNVYEIEIDMFDGNVQIDLYDSSENLMKGFTLENNTSYSSGSAGLRCNDPETAAFDDIRQEETELGGGESGTGDPSPQQTIDDFEDGDIGEYTSGERSAFSATTNNPQSGSYSLESQSDGSDIRMWSNEGNGLPHYFQQGDEWEFYVQTDTVNSDIWGVCGHMFGAQSNGGRYRARVRWHDNAIQLRGTDGNGNTIGSQIVDCTFSLQANTWYRIKVRWDDGDTFSGTAGEMQATIYDANSSDSTTVEFTDNTYTSGGIGWSVDKYDNNKMWFDEVTWLNADQDTSDQETIDSFEDGGISEYYHETSGFNITSTESYLGDNCLRSSQSTRHDIFSNLGDGLNYYPAQGDTFECYMKADQFGSNTWCQSIFFFGVQNQYDYYSIRLKWSEDLIQIGYSEDGRLDEVVSESPSWSYSQDTWYRVEIQWSDGSGSGNSRGDFTVTVEEEGSTNSHTVTGNDTRYSDGGIGWSADMYDNQNLYFDHALALEAINGGDGQTDDGTDDGSTGGGDGSTGDPSSGAGTIHDFENQDLSAYTVVTGNSGVFQFTDSSAEKLGGYQFYENTVPRSAADYEVSNASEFSSAVSNAGSNDVIYLVDDIDLRNWDRKFRINQGVTLAGDRGINGSPGPIIYPRRSYSGPTQIQLLLEGYNRVTGIRIYGHHRDGWLQHVSDYSNRYEYDDFGLWFSGPDIEVDNIEVAGFGGSCIGASNYNCEIHHNHIHRAPLGGVGYGIGGAASSGQGKSSSYIHSNVFHYTRHHIADSGMGSYYVENNSFEGPLGGNVVDMHDSSNPDRGGGDKMEVYNNFFPMSDGTEEHDMATSPWSSNTYEVCYIQRGYPDTGGYYYENWGYNPDPPRDSPNGYFTDETIVQASDERTITEWTNVFWDDAENQYGQSEPSKDYIGLLGDGRQLLAGSNHALRVASGRTWNQMQSTSGLDSYPSAGDSFEFYFRVEHNTAFHSGFLFGVQGESSETGHYEIDMSNGRIRLELDHHNTGAGEDELLGELDMNWEHMQTYQIQVHWPSEPDIEGITIDVYNHTQDYYVGSIEAAPDSTYTSGGIGFFDNSFPVVFFDQVQYIN